MGIGQNAIVLRIVPFHASSINSVTTSKSILESCLSLLFWRELVEVLWQLRFVCAEVDKAALVNEKRREFRLEEPRSDARVLPVDDTVDLRETSGFHHDVPFVKVGMPEDRLKELGRKGEEGYDGGITIEYVEMRLM